MYRTVSYRYAGIVKFVDKPINVLSVLKGALQNEDSPVYVFEYLAICKQLYICYLLHQKTLTFYITVYDISL